MAPIQLTLLAFHLIFSPAVTQIAGMSEINLNLVNTTSGFIKGQFASYEVNKNKVLVYKYLGVPYAESPVNRLRFQPPEVKRHASQTITAYSYSPACMQDYTKLGSQVLGRIYHEYIAKSQYSEDCLYLNVFVPQGVALLGRRRYLKAVMVYIHGGDFSTGSSSWPHLDGTMLALHGGVVVVTFNYRLNVFGFLTVGQTGNIGLLDQSMAMKWVKTNIESFGGDPQRITVFGQGAGADSIIFHLALPSSGGLFDHAILQSAGRFLRSYATTEEVRPTLGAIAGKVGCDNEQSRNTLTCLQAIKGEHLIKAAKDSDFNFSLIISDEQMDNPPLVMLESSGDFTVPVLMSFNEGDGDYAFKELYPQEVYEDGFTEAEVNQAVAQIIHSLHDGLSNATLTRLTELIKAEYFSRIHEPLANLEGMIKMYTHHYFVAPAMQFAEMYLENGGEVYNVCFTHRPSVLDEVSATSGPGFGDELWYVFGMLLSGGVLGQEGSTEEQKMTLSTISTWSSFANNGLADFYNLSLIYLLQNPKSE